MFVLVVLLETRQNFGLSCYHHLPSWLDKWLEHQAGTTYEGRELTQEKGD